MLKVDLVTGEFPNAKSGIGRMHTEIYHILKKKIDIKLIYTNLLIINGIKLLSRLTFLMLVFLREKRDDSIIHIGSQENAHLLNLNLSRSVVTVCDIYPYLYSNNNIISKIIWALRIRGIKRAQKIISISKKTKEDLIRHCNIQSNKIHVIYLGVDESFKPIINLTKLNRFLDMHKLPRLSKYLLYIGSCQKRKNIDKLLLAFSYLKKKKKYHNLKLILITKISSETKSKITESKLENEIFIKSEVSSRELVYYYNIASIFIYPSMYEGFGLPPLEAMASGCPIITSNTSSLPEIVGEAGIMINPNNIKELTTAIDRVYSNDNLKKTMIMNGLAQAKKFRWGRTAVQTMNVYKSLSTYKE